MKSRIRCAIAVASAAAAIAVATPARAGDRLQWTVAVSQVEGAAGGGLVPWALVGGLGTNTEVGANAFVTYVSTPAFELRTAGDAVFDADTWLPQIAVGAQRKQTLDFDRIPRAVGAAHGADVDFYVAATKLYFAALGGRNVILDATLRRTRANQFGLLGFEGNGGGYALTPEFSAAVWLNDDVLLGGEYRNKPNDLNAFRENSAEDIFLAWAPVKNFSVTAAWADLGSIAGKPAQRGVYLSLWLGY